MQRPYHLHTFLLNASTWTCKQHYGRMAVKYQGEGQSVTGDRIRVMPGI